MKSQSIALKLMDQNVFFALMKHKPLQVEVLIHNNVVIMKVSLNNDPGRAIIFINDILRNHRPLDKIIDDHVRLVSNKGAT